MRTKKKGKGPEMKSEDTVEVFVPLLDEGTPTLRGTQALPLGEGLYKVLLPVSNYDPEDEVWEFPPGSIVRCVETTSAITGKKILKANEMQRPDGTFVRTCGGT